MPDKKVLPTGDLAFKKILASDDHKTVTQGFIKDFFGVYVDVDDIHIVNPYSIKSYPKPGRDGEQVLRETRRDVTLELNTADVNVELQMRYDPLFDIRSLYYALDLFIRGYNRARKSGGGGRYASIRQAWALNIIGYSRDGNVDPFQMNAFANEMTGRFVSPQWIRWGYYELNRPDPNPARARWREFLLTGVAQATDPDYLQEAASIIDDANMTQEERDMITWRQKNEDYYDGVLYGAKLQGIEQGIRQKQLDAARAALRRGFGREDIMAITGLDAATVDQLADELVPAA